METEEGKLRENRMVLTNVLGNGGNGQIWIKVPVSAVRLIRSF